MAEGRFEPQPHGDTRRAPMVGRAAELARLRAAYEAARRGAARTVVVAGEAGIGKSRLVTELASIVESDGGLVLTGGCLDLADGGLPFLPVAEAMRGLARAATPAELDRLLGDARGPLSAVVPALGQPGPADEPLSAGRLFEGILALIGRIAAHRPTLVVFEDVHWIDRASRDLATFLARNLSAEPVLFVLTARTEDLDPEVARWLAELGRGPHVERVTLERLTRSDVRAQLVELLGAEPARSAVDAAFRRSDGNPYFVEELASAAGGQLPETLAEIVTARLSVLSAPSREVVRVVAVGGRSIDEELVAAVVDRPIDDVHRALREAVERRVLVAAGGDRRIGFVHALVREVAAAELLSGQQASLHRRLAAVLAERPELAEPSPAGAAAELAFHWEAGGQTAEALSAAIEAAGAAARVAAWADADRQYERVIRLIESGHDAPPDIGRAELLRRAAEAAELSGDVRRAQTRIEAALAGVDTEADPDTAALLRTRLGYLRWAQGDTAEALAQYEAAAALLPAHPPTAARARVLASLAGAQLGHGRYIASRDTSLAAVASAVDAGARSEEARGRNVLGSSLVALGDVETGIAELERSRDLAAEAGPSDMRVVSAYNLAVNLALAGRLAEAESAARQGTQAARSEGLLRRYGIDLAALEGDVLTRLGRWDEAAAVLEAGVGLDPDGDGSVYLAAARARLFALRGSAALATDCLRVADKLAAGTIDADLAGYVARARAELAVVDDRANEALEVCLAALVPLEGTNDHFVRSPLLVLAIQAAADLAERARFERGELDADTRGRARALLEEVQALTSGATAPIVAAIHATAEAEWSRLEGDLDPARWAVAASRLESIPDPFAAAYAGLREAEAILRRDGVRGDVTGLLRDAASVADTLGAAPLRTAIDALARRARIDLGHATDEHVGRESPGGTAAAGLEPRGPRLSPRELEVLRLVADGRTNGEIAEALFISRKTAGVHVTHILEKLAVGNRLEAAMAASRLGLLAPPEPDQRS